MAPPPCGGSRNAAAFALLLVFVHAFGRGGGLKIDNSTGLAAEHNRLILERTLMAWVPTAISLITFGYWLLQGRAVHRSHFSGASILATPATVWFDHDSPRDLRADPHRSQHRAEVHQLHEDFGTRVPLSPRRMLALAVSLFGLAAVASMHFRK